MGLLACDIRRLQTVMNSSVRLVPGARNNDHVTSLLRNRDWLPIAERIEYKLCTLVYRCLHHSTLLITWQRRPPSVQGVRPANIFILGVPRIRLSFCDRVSQSQAHTPSTIFPQIFPLPSPCTHLENFSQLFYSGVLILDFNSYFNIVWRPCSIIAYVTLNLLFNITYKLHYIIIDRKC